MKVFWARSAKRDRRKAIEFVAAHDPNAALRLDDLFQEATKRLGLFPESGRPGTISGTRELLPHRSYRVVYEIHGGKVIVVALVHTSRQWPPIAD